MESDYPVKTKGACEWMQAGGTQDAPQPVPAVMMPPTYGSAKLCKASDTAPPTAGPGAPASALSNEALQDDFNRHCLLWDERTADKDGHSGSPGEWIVERLDELRTEAKKRGLRLVEVPPPTPEITGYQHNPATGEETPAYAPAGGGTKGLIAKLYAYAGGQFAGTRGMCREAANALTDQAAALAAKEAALSSALSFIRALGEELVLAGMPAGDREVLMANVRGMKAAMAAKEAERKAIYAEFHASIDERNIELDRRASHIAALEAALRPFVDFVGPMPAKLRPIREVARSVLADAALSGKEPQQP